jgi:hypothetical protein
MNKLSINNLGRSAIYAFIATTVILSLLFISFSLAEPSITHGQAGPGPFDFTITQTIVDETSFLVAPNDVVTSGSINGVTGGTANGSTDFSIISNNSTGYVVSISFEDNGTDQTMIGDITGSEAIRDYDGTVAGEPSYGYNASSAAQFAYTVESLLDSDTDQSFLNVASICNPGTGGNGNGATKADKCWMEPTVAPFQIVDRDSSAINGATSTIEFDITVPSGAVPVPSAETYTATATLTLVTQ